MCGRLAGFLSIDCGGKSNYTDENKIQWVTDANYIDDLGETADIGNATEEAYGSHLTSLRFFPNPLKKSCYHLPVDPLVPYLLRLWFSRLGNYSGVQPESNFALSIETMGMLSMENVTSMSDPAVLFERILVSNGRVLYICLIRTSESDDPSISAIELRKLQTGMYGYAKPGTMLGALWRIDVGGNLSVR